MIRNLSSITCGVLFVGVLLSASFAGAQCVAPDITGPVITITDPLLLTGECHETYILPAATAVDDCDGDVVSTVVDLGGLVLANPDKGVYTVVYEAVDVAENSTQEPFTVNILDTTPPVISQCAFSRTIEVDSLAGIVTFDIPDFESRMLFISDSCDDVAALTVTQSCSPGTTIILNADNLPAQHCFDITVEDTSGNPVSCQACLTVIESDTSPDAFPVITLNGVGSQLLHYMATCTNLLPAGPACDTWEYGQVWGGAWECNVPFEDWGATAYDPVGGQDVTSQMTVEIFEFPGMTLVDQIDSTLGNEYIIGYSVDVDGRAVTVGRYIVIKDETAPMISLHSLSGISGAHPLLLDEYAEEEFDWVDRARILTSGLPQWAGEFSAPYNFVHEDWNDAVAMPWDCWFVPYEEPGLTVDDRCDGSFSYDDILDNTLAVLVRVHESGDDYDDGDEVFITAEFLTYLQGNFPLLEQSDDDDPNPFYGYRLYYFVPDSSGNIARMSRNILPYYDGIIEMADPQTITLTCDSDVDAFFDELWQVELKDRAYDPCMGDVSHSIVSAGNIITDANNNFIPGTYYREYWIDGYPIAYQDPARRIITVEETLPEIHLLNEDGTELAEEDPVLVLPWCDFLASPGGTLEEQAYNWAANWWAGQPDYDLSDGIFEGYYVTHPCEDEEQLTSAVQVYGLSELQDAMVGYEQTGDEALLGVYTLVYNLTTPHSLEVWKDRQVLLAPDIGLLLAYDATMNILSQDAVSSVVEVECGVSFNLPTINRVWDICVDVDLPYDLAIEIRDGEGNLVSPSEVVTAAPAVFYAECFVVTTLDTDPIKKYDIEINVVDTTVPVITLTGDDPVTVECATTYTDAGATALDACAGDLTAGIVVAGDAVDVGTVGDYVITYNVDDPEGNGAVEVTRTVNVVDTTVPVITLLGDNPVTVECADMYVESGATALDACFGDISVAIVIDSSAVDMGVVGTYLATYNVTDAEGNAAVEVTRTVNVVDTTVPVISLLGDNPMTVECADVYIEPNATALDSCFGDISMAIVIDSSAVDTAVVGTYLATYNVDDPEGNAAVEVIRTVDVVDTTIPVITLLGDNPVTVECGAAYTDAGATALDLCAGDLTNNIVVGGDTVNVGHVAEYTVTYNVDDPEGNAAVEVTRTVNVVDTAGPDVTLIGSADVTVECADTYVDEGAAAADICEGDVTASIVVGGDEVDTGVVGVYVVTYTASDSIPNTGVANRTVTVVDTTPPEITKCSPTLTVILEEDGNVIVPDILAPLVVLDACDNSNLTISQVPAAGTVLTPPDVPMYYPMVITVADQTGNEVSCNTWLQVLDTSRPVIVMNQVDELNYVPDADGFSYAEGVTYWECGVAYDDARAVAYDVVDGDLTGSIVVAGAYQVDSDNLGGEYEVTYTVTNSQGATAEAVRHVRILDRTRPAFALVALEGNRSGSTEIEVSHEEFIDPDLKDPKWLWELKNSVDPPAWLDEMPTRFGAYNSPVWDDGTAMLWSCDIPYYDPGLDVADLCEGVLEASDTVVVVVRVQQDKPDQEGEEEAEGEGEPEPVEGEEEPEYDEQNDNGENEVFIWGGNYGELNAAQLDLLNARWYYDEFDLSGYRIYYFIKDSSGKQGYLTRHVLPAYTWNWVTAGEEYIEIDCGDESIFDTLHELEQQDRYYTSCLGDVSHLIERSGVIDINTPGEYRRVYTRPGIDLWWADRWGQVWKRTVVVRDTLPEIVLLDEAGQPVLSEGAVTQLPLCMFADMNEAEIESYFEGWWAIMPNTGFHVVDACEDADMLTSMAVVWGDGILADALKQFAVDNEYGINSNWLLTYSAKDSLNNNANAERHIVLVEDYGIDLFDESGTPLLPDGDDEIHITVECGDTFVLPTPDIHSLCTGNSPELEITLAYFDEGGFPIEVIRTDVPGNSSVVYTAVDSFGNVTETTAYVEVVDTTPPTLQLGAFSEEVLDDDGFVLVECGTRFVEPADFAAADACDGNFGTVQNMLEAGEAGVMAYAWLLDGDDVIPVNLAYDAFSAVPADYLLIYEVVDTAGYMYPVLDVDGIPPLFDGAGDANFLDGDGELIVDFARLVRVIDASVPLIALLGSDAETVSCGTVYTDAGATAADTCEGDLSTSIVVADSVNTSVPGTYEITYNITDSFGNVAVEVTRTVTVQDDCIEGEPVEGEG
ncbi:MAG: DUF5011 domain-containing protein, partial [Candidatus Hydrogenedentes bacterium]|nr:DUF5011 domain-containing protein [Candidatus Hydrogenedentota bacterium]